MENDLLVIKGKRYGVNELEKLPKSLKPINVTSRSNSTIFGYFGGLNPLSNFFPAPFTYEGKAYHCSEQFIQRQKALLFKDKTALKRIEHATTGHQCKIEGQNITNINNEEWENKARDLCLPGIRQKFIENATPRETLLKKTKGKRIVECCKDSLWGCGMAIHNDKCLNTLLWTNQGIMGEILETVRSELDGTKSEDLPALPAFNKTTTPSSSNPIIQPEILPKGMTAWTLPTHQEIPPLRRLVQTRIALTIKIHCLTIKIPSSDNSSKSGNHNRRNYHLIQCI